MKRKFNIHEYKSPSFSFLKTLITEGAPCKAVQRYAEKQQSIAMIEGRAIDTACLEPDKFSRRFFICEKIPKQESQDYQFMIRFLSFLAAGCTRERAVHFAKHYSGHRFKFDTLMSKIDSGEFTDLAVYIFMSQSKTVITKQIKEMAFGCRKSLRAFEVMEGLTLGQIIDEGMVQVRLEWENEKTGVQCRGYADCINPAWGGFDLKSAYDASPDTFGRRWGTMQRMKYIEQIAAYDEGYSQGLGGWSGGVFNWYVIAVEKDPPYMVAIYQVSEFDREEGLRKFSEWCAYFKHISDNDLWHMGYEYFARHEVVFNYVEGQMEIIERGLDNTYQTDLYG